MHETIRYLKYVINWVLIVQFNEVLGVLETFCRARDFFFVCRLDYRVLQITFCVIATGIA
jgi:hypothetical protein